MAESNSKIIKCRLCENTDECTCTQDLHHLRTTREKIKKSNIEIHNQHQKTQEIKRNLDKFTQCQTVLKDAYSDRFELADLPAQVHKDVKEWNEKYTVECKKKEKMVKERIRLKKSIHGICGRGEFIFNKEGNYTKEAKEYHHQQVYIEVFRKLYKDYYNQVDNLDGPDDDPVASVCIHCDAIEQTDLYYYDYYTSYNKKITEY